MRKIFMLATAFCFVGAGAAYAKTQWYAIDQAKATCDKLTFSPNDRVVYLRQRNFVPKLDYRRDDQGNIQAVTVAYKEDSEWFAMIFYATLGFCQVGLVAGLQSGDINDPNELK
jgi:hypothetical protein